MTPEVVRLACRADTVEVFPSTLVSGYLCLNLVIIHQRFAEAFTEFCAANQQACPLFWSGPPGQWSPPPHIAANCDLRRDLRRYDLIIEGERASSVTNVVEHWTNDSVAFLIGSSVSFDGLIADRGLAPDWGPAVFRSGLACTPAAPFDGPMAVTLRIWRDTKRAEAVAADTARFPACHGGPIHRGSPSGIGIELGRDLILPWTGGGIDAVPGLLDDGLGLWWACGVTPFLAARAARLPLMIVHSPGNAMPSDIAIESLSVTI